MNTHRRRKRAALTAVRQDGDQAAPDPRGAPAGRSAPSVAASRVHVPQGQLGPDHLPGGVGVIPRAEA